MNSFVLPLCGILTATAVTGCGPSFDASISPEPFPIRAAYVIRSKGDNTSASVVFFDADVSCGDLQNNEGCFPLVNLPQHHELGVAIQDPGGVRARHYEGSSVFASLWDDSEGAWQIREVSTSATVDLSEAPAGGGEWKGTFTATMVPGSTRPGTTNGGATSGNTGTTSGGSSSTSPGGTTSSTGSTGGSGSTGTSAGGGGATFQGSFTAETCDHPPRC